MSSRIKLTRRQITLGLGGALGISAAPTSAVFAGVLSPTPAQIEGPFYPINEQLDTDLDLTHVAGHSHAATGTTILVRGRVRNAAGEPLQDVLVDVWQANHHGRYAHDDDPNPQPLDPDFQGWGVVTTTADGSYGFRTIKPGPYSLEYLGGAGWRCRHIHFKVSRDGYRSLTTQMYFRGDPLLARDEQVAKVAPELRDLLIVAEVTDPATNLPLFQFDIVLASA